MNTECPNTPISEETPQTQDCPPPAAQPPIYVPYADPVAASQAYWLANQSAHANHALAQAVIENDRLRSRLAQKEQAADAYTEVATASGCTFTADTLGRLVVLLNREIERSDHFFFEPPFPRGDFYLIKLRDVDGQIKLSSEKFLRDSELFQVFCEVPGVQVRRCGSIKTTATLLRQAICRQLQVSEIPFYAGWSLDASNDLEYWLFSNGSTHVGADRVPMPRLLVNPMSSASMTVTAQQFVGQVLGNQYQPIERLLTIIFHMAALTSLLELLGYPIPLSFTFLVDDAATQTRIKALFSWFHDAPMSLSLPPRLFSEELPCRKDQPLLVLDERCSKHAAGNAAVLEDVLNSHQICWRDGRTEHYIPLRALPIILSSTASSLTVCPDCLVLELPPETARPVPDDLETLRTDYLKAFTQFTLCHIGEVKGYLELMAHFFHENFKQLTSACVSMGIVVFAVNRLIADFHTACNIQIVHHPDAIIEPVLREMLTQHSERLLCHDGLAEQFLEVARSQLASGLLHPCPIEYESLPPDDIVFYNETYLGFTMPAMRTICNALGQSRPLVLRTLAAAGLLHGKPVNSGTLLTRLSVWSVYGFRRIERVYLFSRDTFDRLGEPLTFTEEEDVK